MLELLIAKKFHILGEPQHRAPPNWLNAPNRQRDHTGTNRPHQNNENKAPDPTPDRRQPPNAAPTRAEVARSEPRASPPLEKASRPGKILASTREPPGTACRPGLWGASPSAAKNSAPPHDRFGSAKSRVGAKPSRLVRDIQTISIKVWTIPPGLNRSPIGLKKCRPIVSLGLAKTLVKISSPDATLGVALQMRQIDSHPKRSQF